MPRTDLPEVANFIARLKSRLPEVFLDGFDGFDGRGERATNAIGSVFGRLRTRVLTELRARLIARASGGVRAAGVIRLRWLAPTTTAYTIAAGNVLFQTPGGIRYTNVNNITRTAAQAAGALAVSVRAEYVGTHANMPVSAVSEWAFAPTDRASITWGGATTDAGKDEFLAAVVAGDVIIEPSIGGEIGGGLPASIDLRAAGRGLPRGDGESTPDLRARLGRIPEAVTPTGIRNAVAAALAVDESDVELSEYWQHGFAWGMSGWGHAAWSQRLFFYVLIPSGSPVTSIQSLVDRIKPAGVTAIVLEKSP